MSSTFGVQAYSHRPSSPSFGFGSASRADMQKLFAGKDHTLVAHISPGARRLPATASNRAASFTEDLTMSAPIQPPARPHSLPPTHAGQVRHERLGRAAGGEHAQLLAAVARRNRLPLGLHPVHQPGPRTVRQPPFGGRSAADLQQQVIAPLRLWKLDTGPPGQALRLEVARAGQVWPRLAGTMHSCSLPRGWRAQVRPATSGCIGIETYLRSIDSGFSHSSCGDLHRPSTLLRSSGFGTADRFNTASKCGLSPPVSPGPAAYDNCGVPAVSSYAGNHRTCVSEAETGRAVHNQGA